MRDVKQIRLSKMFVRDVQEENEYRAKTNPDAVRDLKDRINKRLEILIEFPQIGKFLDSKEGVELRMLIFEHHLILYRIDRDTVCVERYLDEKQDYQVYM
ncbi:MAG: type II toxin-antitoxin system RelE/ParE family toxin [Firmicutes bacterium]|nr:type II toxin-antitoxin system RelE/ParE family toxin [Bacillota bacterium]